MNNMYILLYIYILFPLINSLFFNEKKTCVYYENRDITPSNIKSGGIKFDDILLYDDRNIETILKNSNFYSNFNSFTLKSLTIKDDAKLFQMISPIENDKSYKSFLFLSQIPINLEKENYSEESEEEILRFTDFQTKKNNTIKNSIVSIYLIEKQLLFLRSIQI